MGGAERSAILLANELTSRGISVSIVVATSNIDLSWQLNESIEVIQLRVRRVVLSVPKLASYLNRVKPMVLLSFMAHANAAAILASKISYVSTKVYVCERTSLSAILSQSQSFLDIAYQWSLRQLYRFSTGVVANSYGVKEDLVQVGFLSGKKILVIWNGIDYQYIQSKCLEEIPVDNVKIFGDKPVVLATGRLVVEKDYPTLLRIFSRLIVAYDAHLLIIGNGPERDKMKILITEMQLDENVTILGSISNPYPYMRLAQVFAHTSIREGFPNALLEAMACGTAVVSFDCRWGPAEIMENGKWGYLVEQGDENSFLDALKDSISANDTEDSKVRAKQFDISRTAKKFHELLLP